jgi:hypothetical protein
MQNAYVVTGVVTDGRTVTLDEGLPLANGKVRVVVEPLPPLAEESYSEVMAEIHRRQELRGHQPPSREEVDAIVQSERDSWDN